MKNIKERLKNAHSLPKYIQIEERLAQEAQTLTTAKKHKANAEKARKECRAILRYIDNIGDEWTRCAFMLRYVEGKTWKCVGELMEQSQDSVRKMCYRYMEKHATKP